MIRTVLNFIVVLLTVGPALAQAPDVVIVASAAGTISDCRFVDVQQRLAATNFFGDVEIFDAFRGTPTLSELQAFDAVLTFSNLDYQNPDLLGDVLADYAETGGGVVVAVFSMTSSDPEVQISGRWITGGFEVIQSGQGSLNSPAAMGVVIDPAHPSVQGVSTLAATAAFRPQLGTTLVQGNVVARWDDGAILVAQGAMPNRIDVGLYPPSSDCLSTFWDSTGDGDRLVANSLLAVTTDGGTVGTPYCMPNANVTGVPARINVTGSAFVANNDLALSASSLPQFSFSLFLVSSTQNFVPNPSGSAGNLCLGGLLGRYVGPGQVQQSDAAGNISLQVDLTQIPQPLGFVAVQPGETWNFSTWFREGGPAGPSSNFSNGYEITFL